jgi:hypothetical protein
MGHGDKSFAVLIGDGKFELFDSHEHSQDGGLICVCSSGCAKEFVSYLTQHNSLEGRNFALLSLK